VKTGADVNLAISEGSDKTLIEAVVMSISV